MIAVDGRRAVHGWNASRRPSRARSLADLATSDVLWDRVIAIEPLGDAPVYDATVLTTHNFIANGIVAHNSLEQDADVVMFLYRDEVYNKESPDRGAADVIVAKHRAGPTGSMRLVFRGQYARFDNAAPRRDELIAAILGSCSSVTTCWPGCCSLSAGALLIGNVVAIVRPPEQPHEGALERAPLARSLLMAAIGLVGAVWGLATLIAS